MQRGGIVCGPRHVSSARKASGHRCWKSTERTQMPDRRHPTGLGKLKKLQSEAAASLQQQQGSSLALFSFSLSLSLLVVNLVDNRSICKHTSTILVIEEAHSLNNQLNRKLARVLSCLQFYWEGVFSRKFLVKDRFFHWGSLFAI